MSSAMEIGKKLVALCQAGNFEEAVATLYSSDIVSIEAFAPVGKSPRSEGIDAVKGKGKWWVENHQVHSSEVKGPWGNGDRFVVYFKFDVTAKAGPMAGKRFVMEETGLYTVKDDKVVKEEFFYNAG